MNSKNILVSVAIAALIAAVAVPLNGRSGTYSGEDGKPLQQSVYASNTDIHIGSENFPDAYFRNYLLTSIDSDRDEYLSASEIKNTKKIYCPGKKISSLEGISYFTALEELECNSNSITSLNVNQNKALKKLRCDGNNISTLVFDECKDLEYLVCSRNNISILDVSANKKLESLHCESNSLSSLILSENKDLLVLVCGSNSISSLNLSSNTKLKTLFCSDNKISSLSLSAHSDLESIKCQNNQLTSLSLGEKKLLVRLECGSNQLTSLQLDAPLLQIFNCSSNNLTSLDVSKCISLVEFNCSKNQITSLKLGTISMIQNLACNANKISSLDLSHLSDLRVLNCHGNQIKSLDFRNNPLIANVRVSSNSLTSLNICDKNYLIQLHCEKNSLTSLEISENRNLKTLNCAENKLTGLDISTLKSLADLDVSNNQLKSIDVSTNAKLQQLYCENNRLTSIDVTHNPALDKLKSFGNQIPSLFIGTTPRLAKLLNEHPLKYDAANDYSYSTYSYDRAYELYVDNETAVSLDMYNIDPLHFPDENFRNYVASTFDTDGNGSLSESEVNAVTIIDCPYKRIESLKGVEYFTNVTFINCYGNKLKELDVSKNTLLEKLFCYSNQIPELYLTSNTKLKELSVHDNPLTYLKLTECTEIYSVDCTNCSLMSLSIYNCPKLLQLISDVPLTLSSGSDYKTSNKTYSGVKYALNTDVSLIIYTSTEDIGINDIYFPDSNFRKYLFDMKDPEHTGSFSESEINSMTQIECGGKSIADLTGIELFPNLETLACYNNQIASIDLSRNPKLIYFSGYGNKFTEISVRQCPSLAKLIHEATPQYSNKTVRYSSNEGYTFYYFSVDESVKIIEPVWIDETTFPDQNFRTYVSSNFDSDKNGYLDQTEISSVKEINCGSSSITTLKGVEHFAKLQNLVCVSNQISSLDLSENKNLKFVSCGNNAMTELNLQNCTKLSYLDCSLNNIGKLDISMCPSLVEVYKTCDREEKTYKNFRYYEYGDKTSSRFLSYDATVDLTVSDLKPGKVTGLKAVSAGKNKVKLTWNAVEGAEGYLVYAQKDKKYGYVGMTTKGTTFMDTKALDTDWNYYWVFAYVKDENGKMIPGGCEKYVFAKGVTLAVTNLKASSQVGSVKLSWSASEGAEGYLIYGIRPGGSYGYIGMTTKGTTYTDTKASKTDYTFYWVFPYHKNGNTMVVGGTAKYTYGRAR